MNAHSSHRGRHLVRAGTMVPTGGRLARMARRSRMANRLGHRFLDMLDARIAQGRLEAWLPDGSFRILGGRAPGHACEVRLNDWRALLRLSLSGSVGWFRAWQLGEWDSPDPVPLFALFMANAAQLDGAARGRGPLHWLGRAVHALRANHRSGSRRNIAFHYDLGNDFYGLWLDEGMNYSSAVFDSPDEPLEAAQLRKNDRILDRLALTQGATLLEIGCGWGALAQRAVERFGARYDGLTLSVEQKAYADQRLQAVGATSARVLLTDYRDAQGCYDAIASIEMVEAVGQEYWGDYLSAIARLLRPGGRAAIQYICIDDAIFERYAASADFIQTYIFPGGMLISESRFRALAEREGLSWQDVSSHGLDYAETLMQWRHRFDAAVEDGRLSPAFDAKFVALWRYYLMYCEGGFRGQGIDVRQVTLVKPGCRTAASRLLV